MKHSYATALALMLGVLVVLIIVFPPLQGVIGGAILTAMVAGLAWDTWYKRRR